MALGIAGVGLTGVSVRDLDEPRRVFFLVAGFVTSAGAGPASAGLATSVPVAAGVRRVRRFATVRAGVNEQVCAAPGTDVRVNLSPVLRALNEITVGVVGVVGVVVVVAARESPICKATAVYPRVVDATMRPVFPSAVVNWFPFMVSVVSPVSPISSHLNVPA
jgi:hypothetical protein